MPLHFRPIGMPPKYARAILTLHLALPVRDTNLIKTSQILKKLALPPLIAPPLDLPLGVCFFLLGHGFLIG